MAFSYDNSKRLPSYSYSHFRLNSDRCLNFNDRIIEIPSQINFSQWINDVQRMTFMQSDFVCVRCVTRSCSISRACGQVELMREILHFERNDNFFEYEEKIMT